MKTFLKLGKNFINSFSSSCISNNYIYNCSIQMRHNLKKKKKRGKGIHKSIFNRFNINFQSYWFLLCKYNFNGELYLNLRRRYVSSSRIIDFRNIFESCLWRFTFNQSKEHFVILQKTKTYNFRLTMAKLEH